MTQDYNPGDVVDEPALRKALADARIKLDEAKSAELEALRVWTEAHTTLAQGLRGRYPREDELIYARGAMCDGCKAPMAYWPDIDPRTWDCADVLLGRVGTPENKAMVVERGLMQQPTPPPGVVLHDSLPFMCWSVKSDPKRKAR